jgi:hypothetical protein
MRVEERENHGGSERQFIWGVHHFLFVSLGFSRLVFWEEKAECKDVRKMRRSGLRQIDLNHIFDLVPTSQ